MKTKQLLAAVLATLCAYTGQAQSENPSNAPAFQRDFTKAKIETPYPAMFTGATTVHFNEEKFRKFKKMRTGGIILTSIGAGMIIGGAALIVEGNDQNGGGSMNGKTYYFEDLSEGDSKIVAGAFGIVFGVLSTGGGITMWVIGNNKMKKYGGGQMSIQSNRNGLGLAYRF